MEISAQLVNPITVEDQKPTSPSLLHLPSIKLPTIGIDDFLELELDDSFSDILPDVEDDLDSLRDVFNPLRNGPVDILNDTTESTVSSKLVSSQEMDFTVISPDVNSSVSSSSDALEFSDMSDSTDNKGIQSRALQFGDLSYLDASSEKKHPSESRSPSDCCYSQTNRSQSPMSSNPSDFDVGVSTCQFSVSLEDLVREPSPVCAALTHITDPATKLVEFPTKPYKPHSNTILRREEEIRQKFETMRIDYPQDIQQLCQFYMNQSAKIETERLNLTRYPCPPDRYMVLNLHYNNQLNQMMDRVEQSLCLLEDTKNQKSKSFQRNRRQRANFSQKCIQIMEDWYEKNLDHPYPNSITVELIATEGGMTAEQVKKWFGNKRNRSNNTRSLTEIAKKKRQNSFNCFGELFL
ncbi:uncharacterized protein LOC125651184 [Ostrea edulis]|uniref:uncharacterized protein LOC125651184 n=1 Tax=Ostrea edulis TaxID=37623 RepID=UPI0020946BDB|nr:uncharacterized protein LOC125651184 [Ostrea edulis]